MRGDTGHLVQLSDLRFRHTNGQKQRGGRALIPLRRQGKAFAPGQVCAGYTVDGLDFGGERSFPPHFEETQNVHRHVNSALLVLTKTLPRYTYGYTKVPGFLVKNLEEQPKLYM